MRGSLPTFSLCPAPYRSDFLVSDVTVPVREDHQANVLWDGKALTKRVLMGTWPWSDLDISHLCLLHSRSLLLHRPSRDMSGDFELDAEFNAIMTASRSRPALHHPMNRPADGEFGPSHVHSRGGRVPPEIRIQVVCFPPTSHLPPASLIGNTQRIMMGPAVFSAVTKKCHHNPTFRRCVFP